MLTRVRSARRHVDALRSALLSPAAGPLEECLPALEEAASCLRTVQGKLAEELPPHVRSDLRREIRALQQQIAVVLRLIAAGAAFAEGWARMLGAATGGYTPAGSPTPLTPSQRLRVEG